LCFSSRMSEFPPTARIASLFWPSDMDRPSRVVSG
jgi:hypothetical protein